MITIFFHVFTLRGQAKFKTVGVKMTGNNVYEELSAIHVYRWQSFFNLFVRVVFFADSPSSLQSESCSDVIRHRIQHARY